jgi:hypothetical protein
VFNWPGRASVNYDRFIGPKTREEQPLTDVLQNMASTEAGKLYRPIPLDSKAVAAAAQQHPGVPVYVVFTASMRAYDAYYRTYRLDDYQRTLDGLRTSHDWELVRHEDDLWVFQYTAPGWPVGG